MKITGIETFITDGGNRNYCFLKITTDEGLCGVGEAYSAGPDLATESTIHYFAEWLKGMDPLDIERIWQRLYIRSRFPGGSVVNSAISGIDQALWDIKGRALDTPVYQLLGGKCRDRIRVYQNPGGVTPEEVADNAQRLAEQYGFTAFKTNPLPPGVHETPWPKVLKQVEHKMAHLRKVLGDEVDIGLDAHARLLEPAKAVEMCQVLAPYHPMFVEEPLRPENVEAMAAVRAKSPVAIATGEMLYTKWEFRDLLRAGAVDIIQPDICCCGGVTEIKKIAALAEATFLILEYHVDTESPRRDMVVEPYEMRDGYLVLPDKAGFGIELAEHYLKHHPYKPWRRPLPATPDGSTPFI